MIQGTNSSLNLSSGRFSASAKRLTSRDFSAINITCLLSELGYNHYSQSRSYANRNTDQTPIYDSEEYFSMTTSALSQALRWDQKTTTRSRHSISARL